MKAFSCNVAQEGFFAGPVHFIQQGPASKGHTAGTADEELACLHAAMGSLKKSVESHSAEGENANIRQTVISILNDAAFVQKAEQGIKGNGLDAACAARSAADELAAELAGLESEYLRARQDDVRGVGNQLVAVLEGEGDCLLGQSAVCAEEISPAQLASLPEKLIGALLTEKGSANSHASIMAGNMGVPYLFGNAEALAEARKASFIIVDSEAKAVTVDPDEPTRAAALERMARLNAERSKQDEQAQSQASDAMGIPRKTKVCANIEGPWDIEALLEANPDGVGLFRTEFLFIGRDEAPSEDEQYEAYRAVLDAMAGKEVVIRTMDAGSDKKAPWLQLPDESNPALGLRGARVSLERPALFRTQLRALLRAGVAGNLKVMFPMIAAAWEIDAIGQEVQAAARELEQEGISFKLPELGIMVETPAAALCAEEFAQKTSFFSIGTNDLTQYTLAIDREARGLDRYFDPHHEAVFRLVGMCAEGGHRHGVSTAMCGQLAADPKAIRRLIELGVDELSVPIRKVQATKRLVAEAEADLRKAHAENAKGNKADAPSSPLGCELAAPTDGELVSMENIPDKAFSSGALGTCFGVIPESGNVHAPLGGTVVQVASARHAFTIEADDGSQVLVHVGLGTVALNGEPFKLLASQGQRVEADQLVLEADLQAIEAAGLSTMVVVAVLP